MTKMITLFTVAAIVLLLLVAVANAQPERVEATLDLHRVVEAIRLTEAWDGKSVGQCSEAGPFQFRPSTWLAHSSAPLEWSHLKTAQAKAEQRRAALEHVEWIHRRLPSLKLKNSVWSIALVWNAGYGNVEHNNISKRAYDYANRCSNLYYDLERKADQPVRKNPTSKHDKNPTSPATR